MSKILVIALLLGNLLLLAFQALQASPEPESAPAPALPVPPDPGGVQIVLLSEVQAGEFSGPDLACFSLGPFETRSSMAEAQDRVAPVAIELVERESEALVELGYWVTLPAYADFAAAGVAMRELSRAGLQDIAVVNDDDGAMLVSLGYFLEEANARRRRDRVRELGFEAETRLQREAQARFWLDYMTPGEPGTQDDDLVRQIPCPEDGFASLATNP